MIEHLLDRVQQKKELQMLHSLLGTTTEGRMGRSQTKISSVTIAIKRDTRR